MIVVMELTGMPQPRAERIASIDPALLSVDLLTKCLAEVRSQYVQLGATDQVAKAPDLTKALVNARTASFVEAKKVKVAEKDKKRKK